MPLTLPIGTIMPFAGDVTNDAMIAYLSSKGWLPCTGNPIPVATYPELYQAIGNTYGGDSQNFALPDLRGYFVQGVDYSGQATGGVGTTQPYTTRLPRNTQLPFTTDSQGQHRHTAPNLPDTYGECLIVAGWDMAEWNANQLELTTAAGAHTHTIDAGGDLETRPLNVNVDYIIKFQDS